eukprot:tig00001003_g6273.t1
MRRRNVPLDLCKRVLAGLPGAASPLYLAAVMGELRGLIWTRDIEGLSGDIAAVATQGASPAALAPALLRAWAAQVGERPFWDALFCIALLGGAYEAEVREVAGIAPAALALLRELAAVPLGHAPPGAPLAIVSLPFARAVRAELLGRAGVLAEAVRRLRLAAAKRRLLPEREAHFLAAAAASEALAGPARPTPELHLRPHFLRAIDAARGPLHAGEAVAVCLEAAVRCTPAASAFIAFKAFKALDRLPGQAADALAPLLPVTR